MALRHARITPTSTYRLQLCPDYSFADAAAAVPYFAHLGVGHLYLSPILTPVPGSSHGYDVVDHTVVARQLGGITGLERLADVAHSCGIGLIVDVVPNHMAVPTPTRLNPALWSVLRDGPASEYASWFDVDWSGEGNAMLMPVLGARIGQVLAAGQLQVDSSGDEPVLRYFEHEFPVRAGTAGLPLLELVSRQWYRLAYWKVAYEELNYRRFFDVDTLAAVRVENPTVFEQTHRTLLDLLDRGVIDGFRIDHPDGLADPAGYLAQLHQHTANAWVVVEKILAPNESLPAQWQCHGTTGYDALVRVGGLFQHMGNAPALLRNWRVFTGCTVEFDEVVDHSKRTVIADSLHTEVARLVELLMSISRADVRLWDHSRRSFTVVVTELLVAFDRYRGYVRPGGEACPETVAVVRAAGDRARAVLEPELHDTLDVVCALVLGDEVGSAGQRHDPIRVEFCTRFQQTCGPVMAKGVEDTANYRWFPFPGCNEVGGHASDLGFSPDAFHAYAREVAQTMPLTMTTLSTHDTKRSEDVRAVLAALTEVPAQWCVTLTSLSDAAAAVRPAVVDRKTEYLVWHTVVGAASAGQLPAPERIVAYFLKACREAKENTHWVDGDLEYETAVGDFITAALQLPDVVDLVHALHATLADAVAANVLGQKLVQLTMPGVPDVYQGSEVLHQRLVDPDNREVVSSEPLADLLNRLGPISKKTPLAEAKLRVTQQVLLLRRRCVEVFAGERAQYQPLSSSSEHLLGFMRHDGAGQEVVTVVTRLASTLAALGGWGEHTVSLPPGTWRNVLSDKEVTGGTVHCAHVLADAPVALLVRVQDHD